MKHAASPDDLAFQSAFRAGRFPAHDFDHRAHVRLAYVYLVRHDDEAAVGAMRSALQAFLAHHGVDPARYHETMTRAWVLAVRHFMARSAACPSAAAFVAANPDLLDARIMRTHYSAEALLSEEARQRFVEPDLDAIPRYERTHPSSSR